MYEDIGGKIKLLAKIGFIVAAVCCVIAGIVLLALELTLWGLLSLLLGPVLAWVSSWVLYAFGELCEDMHAVRHNPALGDINEGIKILIAPIIAQAKEDAKREAEERTKREAEERTTRESKTATRKQNNQSPVKDETTLQGMLTYALSYQSDDGMIRYLKEIKDDTVQAILQSPRNLIRKQIQEFLIQLQST